ncbi:MAG TPA: cytochrome d ubiquinol oxidase subunit II, partial [Pseudonocardiaceae bacterium]|nr:cytochrome d ubiquinol oxidase subunit II [Pseudonocardiaceae bacterium]
QPAAGQPVEQQRRVRPQHRDAGESDRAGDERGGQGAAAERLGKVVLAVGVCAYLAAVYLCADAAEHRDSALLEYFRSRGMVTAVVIGIIALAGIAVLRADAPRLFDGLISRGLIVILASAVAGISSIVLLIRRRPGLARVAAALAVTAVIWGWALGQYPYLLQPGSALQPGLTVDAAAAGTATLSAMLVSLVVGAALLIPSLGYLFTLFHRGQATGPAADH